MKLRMTHNHKLVIDCLIYRGGSLFQRRREFEREREMDLRDRHKESEEINEIKKLILQEGFSINWI